EKESHSQSLGKFKAGTQTEAEAGTLAANWLAQPAFLYNSELSSQKILPTMFWVLIHSSLIKKMPHRLT
ncbi:hypothetical protein ACQP3D_29040, partial [Escherichia coli]